jgi:hypothetical protein
VLRYGDRLAFTYFKAPAPTPQQLNRQESDIFWLTVDHQLVYLSFFADTGPVSIYFPFLHMPKTSIYVLCSSTLGVFTGSACIFMDYWM